MPVKKTTKTNSEVLEVSKKKVVSKVKSNETRKKDTKKDTKKDAKKDTKEGVKKDAKKELKKDTKKVVVKRRKTDLKPTKASAVAIVSQANRAKKQALIEKVANSDIIPVKKSDTSDTKIPLWVWIFFGCSLLLFCVSFYQAIIRPQLGTQVVDIPVNEDINRSINEDGNVVGEVNLGNEEDINHVDVEDVVKNTEEPRTPEELIKAFFGYMSDGKFDDSFALFDSKAQNDQNIKKYFGAFKMGPFFEGIEGKSIVPQNIQKTTEVYKGKSVYTFDISYELKSTHERFDETWEFVPGDYDGEWKISRIYCITSKCSRHPIFGPEDFGLMR